MNNNCAVSLKGLSVESVASARFLGLPESGDVVVFTTGIATPLDTAHRENEVARIEVGVIVHGWADVNTRVGRAAVRGGAEGSGVNALHIGADGEYNTWYIDFEFSMGISN